MDTNTIFNSLGDLGSAAIVAVVAIKMSEHFSKSRAILEQILNSINELNNKFDKMN